jgi:DNA-binding transcriptional regulator YiaG
MRVTGGEVRDWRIEHDVSRARLAGLLGVGEKTVYTWEHTRRHPTGSTLKLLHILIRGTRGERALLVGLLSSHMEEGAALR